MNPYKLTLIDEPLLFLAYGKRVNKLLTLFYASIGLEPPKNILCGWWIDKNKDEKIISLDGGILTISVEKTFDTYDLPEINPNKQFKYQKEELENLMKRISDE